VGSAAEALRQAAAEGLTLERSGSGFVGVSMIRKSSKKPWRARRFDRSIKGHEESLGVYRTAEEAALAVARAKKARSMQPADAATVAAPAAAASDGADAPTADAPNADAAPAERKHRKLNPIERLGASNGEQEGIDAVAPVKLFAASDGDSDAGDLEYVDAGSDAPRRKAPRQK
jgi:hypothetical protein